MCHASLHAYSVILSFFAAIAGLGLALQPKSANTDSEDTNRMLLILSFAYWLVYCVAFGLQKLISPEWEMVLTPVRLTGVLAYILTFACVVSLPLHQVSVRQVE